MQDGTGRQQYGVEYRLGELAEEVRGLAKWLQGNGKMGVIQELRLDVDALKQTKLEHTTKQKVYMWALRIIGGMLVWTWGAMMGASAWLPKLQALLRALGW